MIYAPDHPHAQERCVAERRLVVEERIGRYLEPWEEIHHKDGNRANNDDSNLSGPFTKSQHRKLHIKENKANGYGH